jgi:predicted unusual protein kinase regulating ubiquinone biosynthesis (AarF/ABC1/UbiB family)
MTQTVAPKPKSVTPESITPPPAPSESLRSAQPPRTLPVDGDDVRGLPRRYDPDAVRTYYQRRPLRVIWRMLVLVGSCLGFAFSLWWDRLWGKENAHEAKRAAQLRELLTRLGPAYIKVGQALSTRPDLVSPSYLDELTQLQDQLPPFANEIAFRFIEEELGDVPQELYAEISDQPLAAASLGQVYRGRLKSGEEVAIKVQRPGLTEQIALDVHIMRLVAGWTKRSIRRIRSDLVAIADEFAARIFEEMDYTQEGANAERFAELYGHLPDIYVPKIYWDYTGKRVLTMEWITGTKLTNLEQVTAQGIDAAYLIEVGVQCSLRQLLEHGFFHADPHPGNLLATPDGKLAYLDFGMMSQVKPYQRYGLIEAVVHMVNRDFSGLAHDYVKLEFLSPETDLTPIIPALAEVFGNALGASVAELNFKNVTDQLSALMYEYPFQVPAYYALIIRSLVTLEGIAIGVDPDFKVLSKAYPYVAKRLLTDPAPELRASLQDLLFQAGSFRWNRLENLLRNARNSEDYDLNEGLDRAIDFLYSERGEFIRAQIVRQLVELIDLSGQTALQRFADVWGSRLGWAPVADEAAIADSTTDRTATLDHLRRIWQLLSDTPGFDSFILVQRLAKLLVAPETQAMGQQIASELAQRAIARLVRELVQPTDAPNPIPTNPNPLPLPTAALR